MSFPPVALSTQMAEAYGRMPERVQRTLQRGFYTLHPRLSWSARRKMDQTDRAFADRFFENYSEFMDYRREFFDGRIVDICAQAAEQVSEESTIYDAHRDACANIYALVRKREPERIVETGVYNGVSTASILLALEANDRGELVSFDYSMGLSTTENSGPGVDDYERGRPSCADAGSTTLPPNRGPGWIIPDDLRERWMLTVGRSRRKLVEFLGPMDEIDVFLHDSERTTSCMLFEFELAWAWLGPNGIGLSFHIDQNDAFRTFVAERDCDHGLFDFEYDVGYGDYSEPCSGGYFVKPGH